MEKPTIIEVEASDRPKGKTVLKNLRNNKMVPAVAYGPNLKNNIHVSIPELELEKSLSANHKTLIKLQHKEKDYLTLIQSVEYHPVTDRPLHVDLFAMEDKTPVMIEIPIRLTGTPEGVTDGGRLYQPLRRIMVQCLPKDIPAEIVLDVSHLDIGDTLDVDSIEVEGLEPLRASYRTIAVIRPPKGSLDELLGLEEEEEEEEGEEAEATEGEAEESGEGEADSEEESKS